MSHAIAVYPLSESAAAVASNYRRIKLTGALFDIVQKVKLPFSMGLYSFIKIHSASPASSVANDYRFSLWVGQC